ncbi:MAG: multicomponent Na+:H+ antiporter subunit C [Candidatus Endobugula sp.]|jgi:multicomponent Na+:H+ antiporter subunit C
MNYLGLYNYWIVVILIMAGLYIMIARHNLIKKIIGLSIFQTGIFYFYISLGKISGGTAPILTSTPLGTNAFSQSEAAQTVIVYSNPLPHVLILTAIVVGVATMAVGLALIVRIYEKYGTIEEDEIILMEQAALIEDQDE